MVGLLRCFQRIAAWAVLVSTACVACSTDDGAPVAPWSTPGSGGGAGASSIPGAVGGRSSDTSSAVPDASTGDGGAVALACANHGECAVDERCALLPGAASRRCLLRCSRDATCTLGSECITDVYGNEVCANSCLPDVPTACRSDETCFTDRGVSYCAVAGTQPEGAVCGALDVTCAPGLQCVHPGLPVLGVARCAASCSVSALAGADGACVVGSCRAVTGDRGGCISACDPFAAGSCKAGWACEATAQIVRVDDTTGYGVFSGQCGVPGWLVEGSACVGGDCAPGLSCGSVPNDYGVTVQSCGAPCSSDHPCVTGVCARLGLVGAGQGDFGTCQTSCTNVGHDCSSTEWCAPSLTTVGLGVCVVAGAVPAGASCSSSADCAKGLLCDSSSRQCRGIEPVASGAPGSDSVM